MTSLTCLFHLLVVSEDGEGIQLSLCNGKAQSGFQRDYHWSCVVSTNTHMHNTKSQYRQFILARIP